MKKDSSSMRTIVICRGLPASGKSSWATQQVDKEKFRWKRINKDLLRTMFDNDQFSPDNEDFINKVCFESMKLAISHGYDVILDNTNLFKKQLDKIHRWASEKGNILVIERVFAVSVKECIERNSQRAGIAQVPEQVIVNMAKAAGISKNGYANMKDRQVFYEKKESFLAEQDQSLPKAIMCDLDGTLALIHNRDPYDASKCDEVDLPNVPVIETVRAMYEQGHHIIFMSGRDSKYREQTKRFIEKYVRQAAYGTSQHREAAVPPYQLHMRQEGDQRKDSIIKRELYDAHVAGKYNVLFVLDDRNSVVDLWRHELGLTCFQVNYGDF